MGFIITNILAMVSSNAHMKLFFTAYGSGILLGLLNRQLFD